MEKGRFKIHPSPFIIKQGEDKSLLEVRKRITKSVLARVASDADSLHKYLLFSDNIWLTVYFEWSLIIARFAMSEFIRKLTYFRGKYRLRYTVYRGKLNSVNEIKREIISQEGDM